MKKYFAIAALVMVVGCSGSADGDDETSTTTTSSASCVDMVFIDGDEWTSWDLSAPLTRDTSGPTVRALGIKCNDVITPGESASVAPDPERPKELLRIDGVPADQALFDPENPSYVYVHAGPEVTDSDSLPRAVTDLLANG